MRGRGIGNGLLLPDGEGLPNLREKTGRNSLDPLNREKRIDETPSHMNLTPSFIGSISKNRVFQCELIKKLNLFTPPDKNGIDEAVSL